MARPGARVEAEIAAFARAIEDALGGELVCLVLHGSAAGADWVEARSDVNSALVVPRVTLETLERLAGPLGRFRERGFALPVVMDEEYLARARDTFPMELDDIRRQHRVLAGRDAFGSIVVERAALQRECEYEARAKVMRLRARVLDAARAPAALEALMVESLKSFLVVLRHLLRLRHDEPAHGYADVLAAGERALGPLPTLGRLLRHRTGDGALPAAALGAELAGYLAEVDRIVAAVDALGA
jgi:hypothetical protein